MIRTAPLRHHLSGQVWTQYKWRTAANQWPKEAQATDWPTIRSTTLLTADPKSAVRRNGKAKSNREKQVRYGNLSEYGFQVDNGTM